MKLGGPEDPEMTRWNRLVGHLNGLDLLSYQKHGFVWQRIARSIFADPQKHIDALIEARVLVEDLSRVGYYMVGHPKHDWYVSNYGMTDAPEVDNGRPCLMVACRGCRISWYHPNRIPVVVPPESEWRRNGD